MVGGKASVVCLVCNRSQARQCKNYSPSCWHIPVFSTPYSTLPYVTLDSLREVGEGFVIPQRRKAKLKAKQNSPEVCESYVKNSALGSQVDSLSKDLPTSQLRAVVSNASFLVI